MYLLARLYFLLYLGVSSNSALYQITNFPSHVLLDKSRRGSRDDNPDPRSLWLLLDLVQTLLASPPLVFLQGDEAAQLAIEDRPVWPGKLKV